MDQKLPQIELISSTAQGSVSSFPFSQASDPSVLVHATINLLGIEVNTIDVALLVLCPVFAALGVMVASLISSAPKNLVNNIYQRAFNGICANIFIGVVVGIVVSLFFIGAINNDITSLARVLVLTVFLGYKAPLFWSTKRKQVELVPATAIPKVKTVANKISSQQDALKKEEIKRARLELAVKG
jgi:hypothetical protein